MREKRESLLSVGFGKSASLKWREIRLGTHQVLAFQKCMVQSSCIPVIFRARLIAHLLGQNVHDCSPRSEGKTQIEHAQVGS